MKLLAATVMSLFLLAFGVRPNKPASNPQGRALPWRFKREFADNQHHAKRIAALGQGIGRIFYWCRAYRFPIPAERSRARWRWDCDLRAWRSHRLAHAPAGSDADCHGGGWLDPAMGWPDSGNEARRCCMDSAGRQALAWSHGNYGYDAHCHCGTARRQDSRLDGKGQRRTI